MRREIIASFPPDLSPAAKKQLSLLVATIAKAADLDNSSDSLASIRNRLDQGLLRSEDTVTAAFFVSVLADLVIQGWSIKADSSSVSLSPPQSDATQALKEKQRVRSGHLIERDRQLADPSLRKLFRQLEETRLYKGQWVSIFSLMRDGVELRQELEDVGKISNTTGDVLRSVIDPYLQFVDRDALCSFTGLRLQDIWRYFRATWSTAYNSVPGRRMHVLVRDRAAVNHPVIGIAALASSVVQSTVRDEWIGWTSTKIIDSLRTGATRKDVQFLDRALERAIDDVYVSDFIDRKVITRKELSKPSNDAIARLEVEGSETKLAHQRYPKSIAYKIEPALLARIDWKDYAQSFLFRSKRATTLARLLRIRQLFKAAGMRKGSISALQSLLETTEGRKAISLLIRSIKGRHVGIDMLDITTCGAVAPYSHLLGGKLVTLMMLSPEVVKAHARRYRTAPSIIASAMKGKVVIRSPRLVLLGTTSLYGVSSSQYNRLKIPASAVGSSRDLEFIPLGRTEGFGSFHFSEMTLQLGQDVVSQKRKGRRVNSIFGEGVNPKLRKLREALSIAGLQPDQLLRHGSPRLVYGAPLAENFREILLDKAVRPKYLLSKLPPSEATERLAEFWRTRWLRPRALRDETLTGISEHTTIRPVRHGARVPQFATVGELPLFDSEA
jgi:hypothetical protein